MNQVIGARIRDLRQSKGITQKQFAKEINWSIEKYIRLENGLIDISYSNITTIANILRVKLEDITSVLRDINLDINIKKDKCEVIYQMLDVFYAHKRLYDSIRI